MQRPAWHAIELSQTAPTGVVSVAIPIDVQKMLLSTPEWCFHVHQRLAPDPSCVKEAAVIGIPDQQWGEMVMACVVLKDGTTLLADEMIVHCRERLSPGFRRFQVYLASLTRSAKSIRPRYIPKGR